MTAVAVVAVRRRAVGVTSETVAEIAMTGEIVTTAGIGMTAEIVTTEETATTAEIATTEETATIAGTVAMTAAIADSLGRDRRRISRAARTIGTAAVSLIDPISANGWIHVSVRRVPPPTSRASPLPTTPTIPSTEDGARCT